MREKKSIFKIKDLTLKSKFYRSKINSRTMPRNSLIYVRISKLDERIWDISRTPFEPDDKFFTEKIPITNFAFDYIIQFIRQNLQSKYNESAKEYYLNSFENKNEGEKLPSQINVPTKHINPLSSIISEIPSMSNEDLAQLWTVANNEKNIRRENAKKIIQLFSDVA